MSSLFDDELRVNWDRLRENVLTPDLPESDILKRLATLNNLFISEEGVLKGYASSEETVSAYTLFYLPTNIPKFFFILNQLPQWIRGDFKKCHFIDIGTGPGTYLLAFLAIFGKGFKGEITGIDRSDQMLRQAKQLLERFFPDQKNFHLLNSLPASPLPGKKILFFGHSINEIGVEKALALIRRWAPDHLFFIEPGTKRVFRETLKLREEMIMAGYKIVYPCPSGTGSCPMDSESNDDWCHQVFRTTHHPGTERLSQLFSKDRRTMPLISHLYSKALPPDSSGFARVVRRVKETKFSHIWEVCTQEGPGGIIRVEILKRGLSRELKKRVKTTDTGTEIRFNIMKKIESNYWRVELDEAHY